MGRVKFLFISLVFAFALSIAEAGTYTLTDGQTLSGEPVSYDRNGVVIKSPTGAFLPRTPWEKFTQESLKELAAEARNPKDREFIEAFLEDSIEEREQRKEIKITQPPKPAMPSGKTGLRAMFSSSLGLALLGAMYLANLYAAFEIAKYRRQPRGKVIGISAAAPVIGPIVFLCLPTQSVAFGPNAEAAAAVEGAPVEEPSEVAEPAAASHAPASTPAAPISRPPAAPHSRPTLSLAKASSPVPPAPVPSASEATFRRGEFTFNRRFFETRMPGFFRVIPSDAEKDMVLYIKAARGEFVGKRISRITQSELHLEIFKDHATAEEMIPFNEIQEVQIRHKDTA